MNRDVHRGVKLPERVRRNLDARDDAIRLGDDHATRLLLVVDDRLRRDVTPAEVLRQRAAHQLTVHAGIERLEWNCLHAAGSSANSSCASATSADVSSRMWVAAWKSLDAGRSAQ